ncbi:hypothetical protein H310_12987 [Aphanomyces invadans]|uniref:Uncharacterized protein n=1 Tax=Aphanomyces invadans TaxID=157072 RepID=A0A024THC7_9STRA|nr:hypothetical protein H310_12987 [Aphanomyces invadans]ETV92757.1 hypothetical protein H310_12987 [Aphanomyces invadans]|eukprot:XP_008878527.1 hypothetical protein H310_12987 [Aphanomyces invadans]
MDGGEIARLKAESAAKDETLNQLKVKAKAFAEALTNEKKSLEAQLAQSRNEMNELKTKAKAFADNVKAQIIVEKERVQQLEKQLHAKDAELLQQLQQHVSIAAPPERDEWKAQVDQLTQQLATDRQLHAERVAQLEHLAQQRVAEKAVLEQQLQQLQWQHTQDSAQREQGSASLNEQLAALRHENQDCHRQVQSVVMALQALTFSVATNVEELVAAAQAAWQAKTARVASLELSVASLEEEKQVSRTTSASLSDKHRQDMAALESSKDQLQADLAARIGECTVLRGEGVAKDLECANLKRQLAQATADFDAKCAEAAQTASKGQETLAECANLSGQVDALTCQVRELEMELSHAKSNHASQSGLAAAHALALEEAVREWKAKEAAWNTAKQDMQDAHDKFIKDEEEKKVKVKAYIQALSAEKQKAVEDVEKQVKERDLAHEKRMADVKAKTMAKFAEHEAVIKKSQEELEAVRAQMAKAQQTYEAEIKALQAKKKEAEDETMEVLKKKRLAAKAETQKLASDLEGVQKRAAMLVDVTGNKCSHQSKQLEVLQERVLEAIHVVSHHKKCDLSSLNDLAQIVTSPRMNSGNLPGPALGLNKIDEDVSHVFDQMTALTNVTERLVDLTLEENDLSLKEIVVDRMKKQFSACFVHQYAKSDEDGLLRQRTSSTMPESPS